MAGLYGVASNSPDSGLPDIASRMGRALAHRSGQEPRAAGGNAWQAGATASASASGAEILTLRDDGFVVIAGAPVFRGGSGAKAEAFEDLAGRLAGPPEAIRAWFESVDGCFAFALIQGGRIFLANDRNGGVPVYAGVGGGKFYWASEVKAIAGEMAGDADLSKDNLASFIAKGFLDPPLTYYRNISQAPERSALLLDLATLQARPIEVFGPGAVSASAMSFDDAKEELKTRLTRTIASRVALADGRDVVVTLSGGLDSRILLAEAARIARVRAVTYGQPDSPEVQLAARVASAVGVPHEIIPVNSSNWLGGRDAAIWMTDGMMDLVHTHIVHVAPSLTGAGVVLDGLFGDVLLGRGAIIVDPAQGEAANRYLRMNRFTYFGPRIEQNFALVATPLVDRELVAFMDSLPAEYTDDSRLYREASGERHGALYSTIPWHKTGVPPYPYTNSAGSLWKGRLMRRAVQASRWVGLSLGSNHLTMDYVGWYRLPHFRDAFDKLVYGKHGMLKQVLDVPSADALLARVPSPVRARLPTRLLTVEVWLRQARAKRALSWDEMLAED